MRKVWAATTVVVFAAGLAGLYVVSAQRGTSVDIPDQGPWVVLVTGSVGGLVGCFEDPAVEASVMSADMPASAASARLKPQASTADVRRIVDCLAARGARSAIQVKTAP